MNRQEYQRQYYRKNRERKKLYMRAYRKEANKKHKEARDIAGKLSLRSCMEQDLLKKLDEYLMFLAENQERMNWSLIESKAKLVNSFRDRLLRSDDG